MKRTKKEIKNLKVRFPSWKSAFLPRFGTTRKAALLLPQGQKEELFFPVILEWELHKACVLGVEVRDSSVPPPFFLL